MPSLIRAARWFRPWQSIMGVKLVWEHETGLERDQWLPRKLRNTATCPMPCADRGSDLDSQFSRQPLIAFEPRFVFSDRLNIYKGLQRPDTFLGANRRRRLSRQVSSPHAAVSTVILSFLGNRWSHSSPVSCFRTDSTSLITGKGQKHSAARIGDGDFESPAPFLYHVQRP